MTRELGHQPDHDDDQASPSPRPHLLDPAAPRRRRGWRGRGLLFWTLASTACIGAADPPDTTPAEDLFRDEFIPKLRLEIAPANLERLRSQPRTYVPATIHEGDRLYTNVSIHLKGGPGSFRPVDDRPAFTINFGREAKGQRFHGLKKLHLNNSVQDATYLSEKICRELFAAAGVPAPRAGHAIVECNGRSLGLYVLVEGIDHDFLQRHFRDSRGNLYDGHSQSDVTHGLKLNSGDNPRDRSALKAVAAAAREPDLEKRRAALEQTLDMDRFLSFIAVEVLICHWDGYALNRNNYRIYHDRTRNRLVFLPQGADQTFQRQSIVPLPPMVGLVAKSALEVPSERERYEARLRFLLTNRFQISAITRRLREVVAKVQPALEEVDPAAAATYLGRAAAYRRRIQRRFNSLTRQLCEIPDADQ